MIEGHEIDPRYAESLRKEQEYKRKATFAENAKQDEKLVAEYELNKSAGWELIALLKVLRKAVNRYPKLGDRTDYFIREEERRLRKIYLSERTMKDEDITLAKR